jgi:aminotransferase
MGLTCQRPRGSFYAFPCIQSTGLSSSEFALRLLREEKVACVPGGAFGPDGEGYLRCCFATAFDQIEMAMERMARFVWRVQTGG